jgi:hypothetical protein
MERLRLFPLVGIVGCVLFAVVLAVPYALLGTDAGSGASAYYGTGAVNPLVGGLFVTVGVIVLSAGRSGRADPGLAAGVALSLGIFLVAVAGVWAVTVPRSLVVGLSETAVVEYHRWTLALVAVLVPAASAAWARTLGVL